MDRLVSSADHLAARNTSDDALRQWLRLAVTYIATKKMLSSAIWSTSIYGSAGQRIVDVLYRLVESAREDATVRSDVQQEDVLRALVGFTYGSDDADWQASALRLIDALMIGIRNRRPS